MSKDCKYTYSLLDVLVGEGRWEGGLDVDGLGNRDDLGAVNHAVLVTTEERDLEPGIDEAVVQLLWVVWSG